MYVYQSDLFAFLLASFACGMFLSALYDVFRVCRLISCGACRGRFSPDVGFGTLSFLARYNAHRRKKSANIGKFSHISVIFISDIFYFLLASLVIVLLFYGYNWGRSRLFSVLGIIGGFFMWRITFGRLILLAFEYLFYIFGALLYFCSLPLVILFQKIKKTIYKPLSVVYNKYNNAKRAKEAAKADKNEVADISRMKSVGNNVIVMEKR